MRRRERERTPSLFSCGCDAPRVTALSWAPCPIDGGMAGNFVPRDGWMRVRMLRVAGVVAAAFAISLGLWNELGEMVDVFSSCMVGGCWRCVPSLRGCRFVVRELCGWACCLLLVLSALSLSRCIRCAPSLSLLPRSFSSVSPIS
ncbi:mucin TcMUC [Trypanosoma cruzi cruzi]|nr:mucin TcMUC [Trypanosoma cruzi cruzi]